MSIELVKYDAACKALAQAHSIDEVKDIRDRIEAIRHYARQAHNKEMEIQASEMRFRAERRIGLLIDERRQAGTLHEGGRPSKTGSLENPVLTLKQEGIDKYLADRGRKYAALSDREFDHLLVARRQRIAKEKGKVSVNLLDDEAAKVARRALREAQLGMKQLALPERRYGVILADPEWKFETWSENGMDRSAENHYPTSPLEVIKERNVASIAAEDCALFLWATVPMLPHALAVMTAWTFTYRSNWVWCKDRIGPGYWNRNRHEILLLGTRGDVPCPAQGQQWDSLLEAPRRGHSEKPEVFHEMIESYFPSLPKIELNRRGPARQGWDAWGNEADVAPAMERAG